MKHLFFCFLLIISTSAVAQKSLEYRLAVGDNFLVEQIANQEITQDINGVKQIIENNLVGEMYFEVLEANKDSYTISMSFKRLKMLMTSPTLGELSNSDTASSDSTDVATMLFKGILNVPVSIVMDKTGKITSVTGGEKLITSMFESAGIDQPELIAASKEQMEKQFGSGALANSMEQMTYFYPADAVAIGDEWANSYTGNLAAKTNWTLADYNSEMTTLTGNATASMSNIDENVMMTLTGTQKTTVLANTKTGLFNSVTVTGEYSGDTLFQAQNMTIPTRIKSTITYKISK